MTLETFKKEHVSECLKVLTFNDKTISKLIEGCSNYSPPENRELPQPPILLRICPLLSSIETVMHLSANCVKAAQGLAMTWSKICPGTSCASLLSKVQEDFKNVQSLRLSSFQALPFKSESFGGYVAENYRAFSVVSPWAYHFLNDVEGTDMNELVERSCISDVTNWSKNQLQFWLSSRGIDFRLKLGKKELVSLVQDNRSRPKVVNFPVVDGSSARLLLLSLNHCLSSFLSMDLTGQMAKNRVNALSRRFLGISTKFDTFTMKNNPTWETSHSMLGLLRVEEMYDFGTYPMCYYEGDTMGEGIVKSMRPLMWAGLRNGWSVACQSSYYRQCSMTYVGSILDVGDWKKDSRSTLVKIKVYRGISDVEMLLTRNASYLPFSFALYLNKRNGERVVGVVYQLLTTMKKQFKRYKKQ